MRAKCAPFASASPPPPAGLRTETWTARRRPDGDDAPGRRAIRLSRERDVRGALRSSFSDSEGERACVRACFVFFSARDGNPHGHTHTTHKHADITVAPNTHTFAFWDTGTSASPRTIVSNACMHVCVYVRGCLFVVSSSYESTAGAALRFISLLIIGR